MKIFSKDNVYEAAKKRVEFLFNEFDDKIIVGFSGVKDSTTVLQIALEVAEQKGKLPVKVMFLDQEAEWQGTIDYVREVMKDERVEPLWLQIPLQMTNNASSYSRYSQCWGEDEKEKWIRDKETNSIQENVYGKDRFHEMFYAVIKYYFPNEKACYLSGVRTQEAPKRFVALTHQATYKHITWGKILDKKHSHYTFYPIYDWTSHDVWKYIDVNNFPYNKVYDGMYRQGVPLKDMRISNLHHETAIQNMLLVQEIEPQTWNKLCDRVEGASSIKHIKTSSFVCPKELPYMFETWEEYAHHLIRNIIQEDKYREQLLNKIDKMSPLYNVPTNKMITYKYWREVINTVLSSDWDFTKLANFEMNPQTYVYRNFRKGKIIDLDSHQGTLNILNSDELKEARDRIEEQDKQGKTE